MNQSPLRAIVIGAGWAGEGHVKALQCCGVEVAAICARDQTVAQAVAGAGISVKQFCCNFTKSFNKEGDDPLKLNTVLTINAVATLLFGLAFLCVPEAFMAMYGATTDATGQFMARYAGSLLLGITIWTWSGRRVTDPIFRRAMIFAHSVPWLIILVLAMWWTLSGLTDSRGWGNVILALLFLMAYGYCWVKPALQAPSSQGAQQ